ncbi:MAG: glycerol-3-phosphate acyltransferase [Phycisphaeraceae bacterium]|nr:MAG: glycerol-3-phosphate acyltransferase [Phycisphaeraceae bacterium]
MPSWIDPLWASLIIGAFLVGSIPFSFLIGLAKGVDIRTVGSKNTGATNLGRALGGRYFALGFTLDMLKGLAPTLTAGILKGTLGTFEMPTADAWGWLAVLAAAVLGHMFSPWIGFRGGKGVATGLGALLGVFPALALPGLGAFVVFMGVFLLWKYVSSASIVAACSLPIWVWLAFGQARRLAQTRAMGDLRPETVEAAEALRAQAAAPIDPIPFTAVAVVLAALVVWRHRANIQRLMAGTEHRVGAQPPATGG